MTKDMTQGSPLKLILAFAVPLMLGSLFQQFYNLADTIIVGRFVGVEALAAATPRKTGKTAASWSYRVEKGKDSIAIIWSNSNIVDGTPIAVILQYGHGTRNGGYVEGVDYINPAMRPIFDEIAKRAWEEVRRE